MKMKNPFDGQFLLSWKAEAEWNIFTDFLRVGPYIKGP